MPKELLFSITRKDFDITHFAAGGQGGQKQNKTASAARVRHTPSGAVAESRKFREQIDNKRAAWLRCVQTPKFQTWLKKEIAHANLSVQERRRLERELQEMMREDNIRVEVRIDGKWVTVQ